MNDTNNIINSNTEEYLDWIFGYLFKSNSILKLSKSIQNGLNFYLQFPDAISICLFLQNEETYSFEFQTSIPKQDIERISELFANLIDKGKIGSVIETEEIDTCKTFNSTNQILIIPLVVQSGVVAICLLEVKGNKLFKSSLRKKISIYSKYLALHFEKLLLQNKFEKTNILLEQKVAVRTMNIAQSKREMQAILNSVQTAILVIDPNSNKIVLSNLEAARLIDNKLEELIGKPISDYLDIDIYNSDLPSSNNFESSLTKGNLTSIPILRSISNISLGNMKMLIESFIDISNRKKSEIALKKSKEVLEQKVQDRTEDLQVLIHKLKIEVAERTRVEVELRKMLEKEKEIHELKTRFISLVSHEFRTPLTIINSAAQIIQNYQDKLTKDEEDDYLSRILKTVDYMSSLLENVIFIGRSDVQSINFSPSKINVKAFCKGLIQDIKFGLKKPREILFKCNIISEEAVMDEKLLRQVFLNIINNALKYSGTEDEVVLVVSSNDSNYIFTVSDNGIGIPEDEQVFIYQQFYRAKNVENISGTGLGMSVVLRCLNFMGGSIEFQSKVGKGTIFTVTIPNTISE